MKILVAVEKKHDANIVSHMLAAWSVSATSTVTVLHVVQIPQVINELGRTVLADWRREALRIGREVVYSVTEQVLSKRCKVKGILREGSVKTVLLNYLKKHRPDVTVMAPQKMSSVSRFLLGSTTGAVLHDPGASILLTKSVPASSPKKERPMIICIDDSPCSSRAAMFAMRSGLFVGARVVLLHVMEPPDSILDRMCRLTPEVPAVVEQARFRLHDRVRQRMGQIEKRLSAQGQTVDKVFMEGAVADQILSCAKRQRAQLVILGSRGLSAGERYLLGSVSTKVAYRAECSVLVVK